MSNGTYRINDMKKDGDAIRVYFNLGIFDTADGFSKALSNLVYERAAEICVHVEKLGEQYTIKKGDEILGCLIKDCIIGNEKHKDKLNDLAYLRFKKTIKNMLMDEIKSDILFQSYDMIKNKDVAKINSAYKMLEEIKKYSNYISDAELEEKCNNIKEAIETEIAKEKVNKQ